MKNTIVLGLAVTALAQQAASVELVGKGVPISKVNRPAYCMGEASRMFGTQPNHVKTIPPVTGTDGLTTIDGTVDKGTEEIKKFQCRFDAKGMFIDVMAITADGE